MKFSLSFIALVLSLSSSSSQVVAHSPSLNPRGGLALGGTRIPLAGHSRRAHEFGASTSPRVNRRQNNNNNGNNNNNNGNNNGNANAAGGNEDPQTSLTIDPSQVQPGLALDGQQTPAADQVASATSTNNFINFCLTRSDLPLTNGLQIKTGSCNNVPMGVIGAQALAPTSKFINPPNLATIAANQDFTVQMKINNLVTGNFVNAQANYFSAPQNTDNNGIIIGHSHVVIEQIGSLTSTDVTNSQQFAFFKGFNQAAVGGILSADVPGGLPVGVYKMSSINSASNHQPVLIGVAQHGSLDDAIYFTVTADGQAANDGGANNGGTNNGGGNNNNGGNGANNGGGNQANDGGNAGGNVGGVTTSSTAAAAVTTTTAAAVVTSSSTSSSAAAATTTTASAGGNGGNNQGGGGRFRNGGGFGRGSTRFGGGRRNRGGRNNIVVTNTVTQTACAAPTSTIGALLRKRLAALDADIAALNA